MTFFVEPTKPPALKSGWPQLVSYGLAVVTTGLAAAQMAGFEDFVAALRDFQLTGPRATLALAIGLLALEVFSVPFLLRLRLSRLARATSALFALVAPYGWLCLVGSALLANRHIANVGYAGGFVAIPTGSLAVALALLWAAIISLNFRILGGRRALQLWAQD